MLQMRLDKTASIPKNWHLSVESGQNSIAVCQIIGSHPTPIISRTVAISGSMQCSAVIHGRKVSVTEKIFKTIDLLSFIKRVEVASDYVFITLCRGRNDNLYDRSGIPLSVILHLLYLNLIGAVVAMSDRIPLETVRHVNCQFLVDVDGQRCSVCKEYRKNCFAFSSKTNTSNPLAQSIKTSRHTNHRFLSSDQMCGLIKSLLYITYKNKRMILQLQSRISQLSAERGIELEHSLDSDLRSIGESHDQDVIQKHP